MYLTIMQYYKNPFNFVEITQNINAFLLIFATILILMKGEGFILRRNYYWVKKGL